MEADSRREEDRVVAERYYCNQTVLKESDDE